MERKFDKNFLIEQIKQAQEKLDKGNISESQKFDLESMISKFTEYLGENKSSTKNNKEKYIFDKNNYKKINDKLKKDLELIDINFWGKIFYLYNNLDHSEFEEKNYNYVFVRQEEMFDMILKFYKTIDNDYYKKALQIIQCPTSLINFSDNIIASDECFSCEVLKAPFINIRSTNDDKYIAFIHELQHGIDYLLKGSPTFGLLSELPPIFFESLFIDLLSKTNECETLYNCRINATINNLYWLNSYAKILILFDKYGRKITKNNIKKIFYVQNNFELKYICEKYMKIDFIDCWRYMLSFLISIKLRNEYYKGNEKEVINVLKGSLFGKYTEIDFNDLINNYNNFIEEIKAKQKVYQKIVNI